MCVCVCVCVCVCGVCVCVCVIANLGIHDAKRHQMMGTYLYIASASYGENKKIVFLLNYLIRKLEHFLLTSVGVPIFS